MRFKGGQEPDFTVRDIEHDLLFFFDSMTVLKVAGGKIQAHGKLHMFRGRMRMSLMGDTHEVGEGLTEGTYESVMMHYNRYISGLILAE